MKNKSLNLKKLIYALFILGMVSLVGCKREELGMQDSLQKIRQKANFL